MSPALEAWQAKWSERQDSNLRPLRPERKGYLLSY